MREKGVSAIFSCNDFGGNRTPDPTAAGTKKELDVYLGKLRGIIRAPLALFLPPPFRSPQPYLPGLSQTCISRSKDPGASFTGSLSRKISRLGKCHDVSRRSEG